MPVTISLLNALSGVAAAFAGFALGNFVLVAVGGIVGASGLMLTQIMCRAFGATRSRSVRQEAYKNAPEFDARLDAQNRKTFMNEIEALCWWGAKAHKTAQEGEMYDRNYDVKITGDRWFGDGIENFLLTAADADGNTLYDDHVMYVPHLTSVAGRSVSGQTWGDGFMNLYKGLADMWSEFSGTETIPVYCGRLAYSDTMEAIESMFCRQVGETTKDTFGFNINRIQLGGVTFEFHKHMAWYSNPDYERVIGIVDPKSINLKTMEGGDFRRIDQREKMPSTVDVGDTWRDGYTNAYFFDGGFEYTSPDTMFIVRGVGLDFASA